MNKKFLILIIACIASIILLFSFSLKKIASSRSGQLLSRIDLKNRETLFNAAQTYLSKKDYLKAKAAFKEFLAQFPDSAEGAGARKEIEKINIKILFSNLPAEDSITYEIKRGDTLGRLASRFNTTVELLKKSNSIKGDLIMPGNSLKVNKAKFDILVNRSENTLRLRKSGGETVKTYLVSTGENLSTPLGTFKIEEKLISPLWYKVGAIVRPDSSEYELGSRWMGLSAAGYGIHGTREESSIGKHITKGCVRMKNNDVEELYAIVPSGTEVTIVE
jgi:L,D-transpeptidase ErfK/SrfK